MFCKLQQIGSNYNLPHKGLIPSIILLSHFAAKFFVHLRYWIIFLAEFARFFDKSDDAFFSKLFYIYLFLAELFFILLLALNLKKMVLRKGIFNSFLLNDLCLLCFIIEAHGFLGSIHSENDFQRKYLIRKPFYNKPFLNDFSLYTPRDSNRIVIWLALQDVTT